MLETTKQTSENPDKSREGLISAIRAYELYVDYSDKDINKMV